MARRIEVEIVGDSRSLERAFARSERSAKNFNRNMTQAGRGAVVASVGFRGLGRSVATASGAFLGAAGLAAAAKVGFDEMLRGQAVAADTAAALKSTGSVAGVTATEIEQLGTRLQQLTGYDDELIRSAENLVLTFTNVRNVAGAGNDIFNQSIKSTLDLSRRFDQDLSTSAVQLGKALQDPVRGVTALRRAGVSFSAQQQRLINRLVSTGRLLEAQKILLAEVRVETGGAAEAYGQTLPGALDILQGNLENLGGELAETLAPKVKELTDQFNKWLANPENKQRIIDGFTGGVNALGDAMQFAAGTAKFLKDAWDKLPDFGKDKGLLDYLKGGDMRAAASSRFGGMALAGGAGGGNFPTVNSMRGVVPPSFTEREGSGAGGGGAAPPGLDDVVKNATGKTPAELRKMRNQWFDAMIGRQLTDVQDITSIKGQIARLKEISAQVTARIAVTKDITRKLNLEDQVKSIGRERRGLEEQLADTADEATRARTARKWELRRKALMRERAGVERKFGWLAFAAERAEATKTITDDIKVQRKIEAALKLRIAQEGRTLDLVSELWRTRQRISELGKKDKDPLAGLMQASSQQLLNLLSAGTGLRGAGRSALRANIAGLDLPPIVIKLDSREVGRAVTKDQARTSHRTAKQTSGFRG